MTKKEDILSISNTVYDYFRKNKNYPKSVKIKGIDYTIQESTYLMCSLITSIDTNNIDKIKVGGASAPTGDRINREVTRNTYIDMCTRCKTYILENNSLPNYVTVDGVQKCSIILFMLQISKILTSYKQNKNLPAKILINSNDLKETKTITKKYGRSKETGCDNRGQNNGYFCAPHMVQEIIRNLTGKVINQSTLAGWMGTTTDGTDHNGISTAFAVFNRKYGYNLTWEWRNFNEIGWSGLKKILESDNQDAGIHELYRNEWGHYTNFDKIYTNSVDVHNSLGSKCNKGCYCGYTENRTKSEAQSYISGISQKSVLIVTKN